MSKTKETFNKNKWEIATTFIAIIILAVFIKLYPDNIWYFFADYQILIGSLTAIVAAILAHRFSQKRQKEKEAKIALSRATVMLSNIFTESQDYVIWEAAFNSILKTIKDNTYTPKKSYYEFIELIKEEDIVPESSKETLKECENEIALFSSDFYLLFAGYEYEFSKLKRIISGDFFINNISPEEEVFHYHAMIYAISKHLVNLGVFLNKIDSKYIKLCEDHGYKTRPKAEFYKENFKAWGEIEKKLNEFTQTLKKTKAKK